MSIFSREQLYVRGVAVTRSLFADVNESPYNILRLGEEVEFLSEEAKELPLLRDYYREWCRIDPTEYTFAMEVFGSWDFWETLSSQKDMKPELEKWRKEIALFHKSRAVKNIAVEAIEGKSSFQANKWLYDNGYVSEKPRKEVKNETKPKVRKEVAEDMARLGLKVVEGE